MDKKTLKTLDTDGSNTGNSIRYTTSSRAHTIMLSTLATVMLSILCACMPNNNANSEADSAIGDTPVQLADTPNTLPPLQLASLDANSSSQGIDYIIDGSASMCGYFNADVSLVTDPISMPITRIISLIQPIKRSNDRILIFMQDKSADTATYLPFDRYENQLMQGDCDLKGQYTQLGIILSDYRPTIDGSTDSQNTRQGRSLVMISDMHFLPAEQRHFDQNYNDLLTRSVDVMAGSHQAKPDGNATNKKAKQSFAISNGLWSIRSPFVGDYFSVNNDKFGISNQLSKHLHIFWFTKSLADAQQIQKLQQQLQLDNNGTKYKNSVLAQAEFLPQVRLLTAEAKGYQDFSPTATNASADQLIDLYDAKTPAFISAHNPSVSLSEGQKHCYELAWQNDNSQIDFYFYPNASSNKSAQCSDGSLFRSKTGDTLQLNLPIHNMYKLTLDQPNDLAVADGFLSIPFVNKNQSCIGVQQLGDEPVMPFQGLDLQYSDSIVSIDSSYYAQFSLERDCDSLCEQLTDKTYLYDELIRSLANKAKQHINATYPRSMYIQLNCKPNYEK